MEFKDLPYSDTTLLKSESNTSWPRRSLCLKVFDILFISCTLTATFLRMSKLLSKDTTSQKGLSSYFTSRTENESPTSFSKERRFDSYSSNSTSMDGRRKAHFSNSKKFVRSATIGGHPIVSEPSALFSSAQDSVKINATESNKQLTLSESQHRVLRTILERKSVFFSGAAGSGKSYLLQSLQEVLSSLNLGNKIAFTAPTGVAACNISGMTINSWAGVGLGTDSIELTIKKVMGNQEVRNRWRKTEILVIDEISMLSSHLFELLSVVGKRARADERPFGGLQLVLCGDFFQLPPVGMFFTSSLSIQYFFQSFPQLISDLHLTLILLNFCVVSYK
jgi:ATP-dependent DNA helicase PIF1